MDACDRVEMAGAVDVKFIRGDVVVQIIWAEAENLLESFYVGGMIHGDRAVVGVSFGQGGDHDLGHRECSGVAAFGFVVPNDDQAVVFERGRGFDLGDYDREEIVSFGDGGLIVVIVNAVVGIAVREGRVGIVV